MSLLSSMRKLEIKRFCFGNKNLGKNRFKRETEILSFFHLTTLVRRRRNKIDGLHDVNGSWCDTSEGMKIIAKDFF